MCLPLSLGTDQSLGGEGGLCLSRPRGVSIHPQPSQMHHSVLTLFPGLEWMPIHTRACVGTLIGYVYSLGQFLLAGVAYAVPHWRPLQLLVSVPFFAFFIYSWCVGPRVGRAAKEPRGLQGTRHPPDLTHATPQNQRRSHLDQCL